MKMRYFALVVISMIVLSASPCSAATTAAASAEAKGKTCRTEQQCRWENFKKICVYVKVCR
jgi:hypothetical protein